MRHAANRGFLKSAGTIRSDILIPRYYDPTLQSACTALAAKHTLVTLGDLTSQGLLRHDHGNYIPKITYGTGPYPYIRTSDLANWELKASPKHGVALEVFDEYSRHQDVRPGDILFVHEGTYLVGTAALVTPFDGPLLYQHHLAKFRVLPGAPCGPYFLMAALHSSFMQRQIRSKQFSADIIDSVVGRLGEVVLPVPKDPERAAAIEKAVSEAILSRAQAREKLSYLFLELNRWLQSDPGLGLDGLFSWTPSERDHQGQPAFLGSRAGFSAFKKLSKEISGDILLPKYYDPFAEHLFAAYSKRCQVVSVGELVGTGVLELNTGNEVGKLSYGTGSVPFIRTSDFASYEIKRDPKQGVGVEVWKEWQSRQDVHAEDILLVRDGTYLVGTTAMVAEDDLPMLYCGGLIKIRCIQRESLAPGLLYALLNLPFVRRQMRNKQFTRDVIDTLGRRFLEVKLPIPKDASVRRQINSQIQSLLELRNAARHAIHEAVQSLYPVG